MGHCFLVCVMGKDLLINTRLVSISVYFSLPSGRMLLHNNGYRIYTAAVMNSVPSNMAAGQCKQYYLPNHGNISLYKINRVNKDHLSLCCETENQNSHYILNGKSTFSFRSDCTYSPYLITIRVSSIWYIIMRVSTC